MAMRPEDTQRQIDSSGGGWTAGQTVVSNCSRDEMRLWLGAPAVPQEEIDAAAQPDRHARPDAAAFPSSFDWRNVGGKNFITPVKNQNPCGSCVAFGSLAAVEGTYQVQKNDPDSGIDLSEAQMFYCYAAGEGMKCLDGWFVDHAFSFLKEKGVTTEDFFPYTPQDQPCSPKPGWEQHLMFAKDTRTSTSVSEIKQWISTTGPVTSRFNVFEDFQNYDSGVYFHTSGGQVGGHCVCIVGYNDSHATPHWIVKNSWGPEWGENGYFRIAYGQCGIDARMWLVNGVSTS